MHASPPPMPAATTPRANLDLTGGCARAAVHSGNDGRHSKCLVFRPASSPSCRNTARPDPWAPLQCPLPAATACGALECLEAHPRPPETHGAGRWTAVAGGTAYQAWPPRLSGLCNSSPERRDFGCNSCMPVHNRAGLATEYKEARWRLFGPHQLTFSHRYPRLGIS